MTEVRIEDHIHWDGYQLSVWVNVGARRVFCLVPRDTIHSVPMFNDALTREIARDRLEIVDRLRPWILAKIKSSNNDRIFVSPSDVAGFKIRGT